MQHSMKLNSGTYQTTAGLLCLLCSLTTVNAQGQTPSRRPLPYRSTTYNGQTTIYSPYAPYRNTASVPPYMNSLQNTLPTSGTASTQAAQPASGAAAQQQSAGSVTAQFTTSNEVLVQWSGDKSGVRQVTLGLFDSKGQMLDQRVLTQLPVMAHFAVTEAARYYGAQVTYTNGKTTTMYQPLQ